jgi:phospho-N-acetylmuramoyl-pentapeptide-transferase
MFFLRYPTYQIFITAVVALVITALMTPLWIRVLKRLGIGQVVRVDGPQRHLAKAGTPTMGGVLILLAVSVVYSFFARATTSSLIVLATIIACGIVGFVDDYRKVVKARSLGLRAKNKLFWQFVIASAMGLAAVNVLKLDASITVPLLNIAIPLGKPAIELTLGTFSLTIPFLYLAFVYIVITATVNSVNLTDGLDGLAAGTIVITMLAYTGIAFRQNRLDLAILCAAIGGACIGFLWYNSFPANIFMGDTGSFALGGAVATLAILTQTELLLLLIGGIYVIEALSVIGQVISFRWFGTRIFKMAPIHHHFEILGWSETQVMIRFWIIAGLLSGIGFAIYFVSYSAGG